MTLSSVDLPAPFSPRNARISPGRASSDTSLSAWTLGKALLTPRISRPRLGLGTGVAGGWVDAGGLIGPLRWRCCGWRCGDRTGAEPPCPAPVLEERAYLLQFATDVLSMTCLLYTSPS